MNRFEFIDRLGEALEGNVPPQVVGSNKQYYQDYIRSEMGKGRSEEEVLQELGDPRLIARTIFDSQEAATGHYGEQYTYESDREDRGSYREDRGAYRAQSSGDFREFNENGEAAGEISLWQKMKPTVILVGIVVVILVILSAVFSLALGILMSPVFWVILAIVGVSRFFLK